jgi:hypothetical protein
MIKNKPDKGLKGGSCNVTACQEPGANYYNKSTQKYYCKYCADRINWPGGRADTMALFGVPLLCELDKTDATWSKTKPTIPGWYAWRVNEGCKIYSYLTRIYLEDDVLMADMQDGSIENTIELSEIADREWYGPIPE